ncbi:conserved hypothetical protein [Trichinella spiralis]|uniref:hypothetical protein n=1 Tax=Trichinella spiralis TaxID=6334 RepID=UPI0001EFC51C|nr:conserved hypothetical protein [Trichinella spiralis]
MGSQQQTKNYKSKFPYSFKYYLLQKQHSTKYKTSRTDKFRIRLIADNGQQFQKSITPGLRIHSDCCDCYYLNNKSTDRANYLHLFKHHQLLSFTKLGASVLRVLGKHIVSIIDILTFVLRRFYLCEAFL